MNGTEGRPSLWASLEGFWPKFVFAFRVLRRSAPLLQICLALAALIVAIWFGDEWLTAQSHLSSLLVSIMGAKTEIVAQPYTGLETYLLSNFGHANTQMPIPGEVQAAIAKFQENLAEAGRSSPVTIVSPGPGPIVSAHDQYLTLPDSAEAFMFVPGLLVPRPHSSKPTLSTDEVRRFVASSQQLAYDIRVAAKMLPRLPIFDGLDIDGKGVVQSYFMTETGVLLIRESGTNEQGQYYSGFLPAHRFHPERAYFWPTVEHPVLANQFDSVSEAYVDSAGNGPIRTYCKRITEAPASVLCLDTTLRDDSALTSLSRRVEVLGGKSYEVECSVSDGGQSCGFKRSIPPDHSSSIQWLTAAIVKAKAEKRLSDVFGKIVTPPCDGSTCASENIEFAVPLESNLEGGLRKVYLLWASVNLKQVRDRNGKHAIIAASAFSTCVLLVLFVGIDYRLKVKQQRELLKNVSRVMEDSCTPFAWTDERNRFVRVNKSFLKTLGYENFEDLVGPERTRTFREILTPPSRQAYDNILMKSQEGKETDPYEVDFFKNGETRIVHATVHGERVPFPGLSLIALPHRFGILVRWEEAEILKADAGGGRKA